MTSAAQYERMDQRLPVVGPLVGRLVVDVSQEEIDCRPFEVSNGGLGIWTSVPLVPGTILYLTTGEGPGSVLVHLKVTYCLGNHLNTDLFRCGLEAVGTKIDFFGAREGLKIVPSTHEVLGAKEGRGASSRTSSSRYVTRTDAALHDARNFLQVVQDAAEIITMIPTVRPELDAAQFAKRILKAVAQLAHCIEDIHQDQQSLHSEGWKLVPIGELLRDAQDVISGLAEQSGVAVVLSPVSAAATVRGKPKALLRVLMNLLVNANTAAAASEDKWIRIESEQTDQLVVIRVSDSGIMLPEVKKQIFKAFFSTKSKRPEASGIGLTFSQSVVEHHGGRIYLGESAASTTFVVELPRADATPGERLDD